MTHFAIVGVGPKGLYAFERLLALLSRGRVQESVEIDLFEASGYFGCGQVYSPENPDYLLLNYSAANVDMWSHSGRNDSGVKWAPNLVQWLTRTQDIHHSDDDFVSRSLVGRYLSDGFERLLKAAPPCVTIRKFHAKVTAAKVLRNGRVQLRSEGENAVRTSDYDRVLLSTGHQFRSSEETLFSSNKEVTSVFPVRNLDHIAPRSTVAIRGMGLTFIDCALALTEGRAGTFIKQECGHYHYLASGAEPSTILPYSRSGKLMTPRAPSSQHSINDGAIAPLDALKSGITREQIDFDLEVLPVIQSALAEFSTFTPLRAGRYQHLPLRDNTLAELRRDLNHLNRRTRGSNRSWVWPAAVPAIRRLYEFGGFTPESQRRFDGKWAGELARMSFGPPAENAEKLLALAEAGILRFDFSKSPSVVSSGGGFMLTLGTSSTGAHYHINATIPGNRGDGPHLAPLYRSIVEEGAGQLFRNGNYEPGCLAIDRQGKLISPGASDAPIHLYGSPTEGVVFDNDTLSRDANNFADSWASACINHLKTESNV